MHWRAIKIAGIQNYNFHSAIYQSQLMIAMNIYIYLILLYYIEDYCNYHFSIPCNVIQYIVACLRCAAGITWIDYKGDNISKYVSPTVIIEIARKITKFANFLNFDA